MTNFGKLWSSEDIWSTLIKSQTLVKTAGRPLADRRKTAIRLLKVYQQTVVTGFMHVKVVIWVKVVMGFKFVMQANVVMHDDHYGHRRYPSTDTS